MPAPFIETPKFPVAIALRSSARIRFHTTAEEVDSGAIYRNLHAAYESMEWDVGHRPRPLSQFQELSSFFRAVRGNYYGFRFNDPADNYADTGEGVFLSLGGNLYQAMRRYTVGATTYDKPILKPYANITIVGSGSYVLDETTGKVTATGAAPTSWVGNYDKPAIFLSNEMQYEIEDRAGSVGELLVSWPTAVIKELKSLE